MTANWVIDQGNRLYMKLNVTAFFVIALTATIFLASSRVIAQTPPVAPVASSTPRPISKEQRETIETVVREYLLKNPGFLIEVLQAAQAQAGKDKQERAAKNLRSHGPDLLADAGSPTAGNPKADVSVVVFFDYNCGYCKKTLPDVEALMVKDPMVRIVYKEFPILGPESEVAARAALAADRQGKYVPFHRELISSGKIDTAAIKAVAAKAGLDYAVLEKDMADPRLLEIIARNAKLASLLEIDGTPGYVVGDTIIPGAVDGAALARIVATERAKLKKPTPAGPTAEPVK